MVITRRLHRVVTVSLRIFYLTISTRDLVPYHFLYLIGIRVRRRPVSLQPETVLSIRDLIRPVGASGSRSCHEI